MFMVGIKMLNNFFIDTLILLIFLVVINKLILINKILIDDSSYSDHKYSIKKDIPLSGGLFFFLSILYLNFKYLEDLSILFYIFPLAVIGFFSDKNFLRKPILRLILQSIILFFVIKILDIFILPERMSMLETVLSIKIFNNFFILFCLLVLINGSNFLDGLNGLSSGYYLLIIISILLTEPLNLLEMKNNIFASNLLIPLIIFFLFNLFDRNFMGDNGIYFLSAYIGINLIELFNNNVMYISPFYIASLLWLPAFENLFSIIRRLFNFKDISSPDNLHLHALLYNGINDKLKIKFSNSLTALIILLFCIPGFVISTIYQNHSNILVGVIIVNIVLYVILYQYLKK